MLRSNAPRPAVRGSTSRSPRRVVVVGGCPERAHNLHDLLVDTNDYDVVVMESIAHGYSRIKQVAPDLVIVLLEIDDAAACQLLSMLKVDRDLSRIPLVTCATRRDECDLDDESAELAEDMESRSVAVPMN
jgi:DNA-binding NarL/FixJ family response regulator